MCILNVLIKNLLINIDILYQLKLFLFDMSQ